MANDGRHRREIDVRRRSVLSEARKVWFNWSREGKEKGVGLFMSSARLTKQDARIRSEREVSVRTELLQNSPVPRVEAAYFGKGYRNNPMNETELELEQRLTSESQSKAKSEVGAEIECEFEISGYGERGKGWTGRPVSLSAIA
ncbi:hypothetical protein EVAR_31919_1 [Eumeta japonica]|uniref:Uncharacterized protein n=1 Tax=Eumeta variegata TaxID=151549 RepID=A0A4C1XRG1_EUMVA|nr:hypothetical protein EVAR_31919_1 [Eumeta japonica]